MEFGFISIVHLATTQIQDLLVRVVMGRRHKHATAGGGSTTRQLAGIHIQIHPGRKKVVKKSPSRHHRTLCRVVSSQLRQISTIGKMWLRSNISLTCPHNMVNFSPLTAEIGSLVWGTQANFNGLRVLAALLHGTLVVGVSQTLRR